MKSSQQTTSFPSLGKRDPTPEEIRERCASIREGWTDATFRQRSGVIARRWRVPSAADPRTGETGSRMQSTEARRVHG